ncbi:PIG-L family deacetylase [Streptomyces vinaceus]|uniref:PIG-L family deacetylase n=1 Tax=Streptomyces vinaceus TaxID=1960 RepID=UPI00380128D1
MDFVAHPDDDLYFMNPDIRHSVADGRGLTTVFLTSGEADGHNLDAHREKVLTEEGRLPPADRPLYSEARQNGIRAAYAQMATGDRGSAWRRSRIDTAGRAEAELDVLVAKPSVRLVWLETREAESVYGYAPHSLRALWDERTDRIPSQLVSGGPVKTPFTYTREQLTATLTGLLEQYRPTLVRTQDPTPGKFRTADHQDHIYGARFVQAALARYAAQVPARERPHFTVENYLGYQSGSFADVLDPVAARAKLRTLETYGWTGHVNYCHSPAGCGDLKVAVDPQRYHWSHDIRYARGNGTTWTAATPRNGDWAFATLDGQMAYWRSTVRGAPWLGPRLLPGTGLDQGAETVVLPDGRVAVFGTRTHLAPGAGYTRSVVYSVEQEPGGSDFTSWNSLGAPATSDPNGTLNLSAPAVTSSARGQLTVYVRDGDGTLRACAQSPAGSWGPWQRLGGSALSGDPEAATASDGTVYLFVPTRTSVSAWTFPARPGRRTAHAPTGLPATTLPLTVTPQGSGVRLWFRRPGTGDVLTASAAVSPQGRLELTAPTHIAQGGGYGAVAACDGVVLDRAQDGRLDAVRAPGGPWHTDGPAFVGGPSALCVNGTATVAVIGQDGGLHTVADEGRAMAQTRGR